MNKKKFIKIFLGGGGVEPEPPPLEYGHVPQWRTQKCFIGRHVVCDVRGGDGVETKSTPFRVEFGRFL